MSVLQRHCLESQGVTENSFFHVQKTLRNWFKLGRWKWSGRLKATTESEDKLLRVNSWHDRRLTGQQLQAQFNSGRSKQVSISTVERRLQVAGLTGVSARTTEDWKKVLWTDESKFEILCSSCRIFVHRRVGKGWLLNVCHHQSNM